MVRSNRLLFSNLIRLEIFTKTAETITLYIFFAQIKRNELAFLVAFGACTSYTIRKSTSIFFFFFSFNLAAAVAVVGPLCLPSRSLLSLSRCCLLCRCGCLFSRLFWCFIFMTGMQAHESLRLYHNASRRRMRDRSSTVLNQLRCKRERFRMVAGDELVTRAGVCAPLSLVCLWCWCVRTR